MLTVFTLCSANYLAHARALGDSVVEHNPDCRFVIGLVDRMPTALEPSYWHPHEVLPVEELNIPEFDKMADAYNLVELNTAVKPFYMEHLYRRNEAVAAVIYLDPDILVFGSFGFLLDKLKESSIILTPHHATFDGSATNLHWEKTILTVGIYNLGFIATSRSETTFAFLDWWQKRVRHACYYRPGSGVFVDQLWVNLAPIYFPNVYIEKDPGYNMSYWNHFERRLAQRDGRYLVNGSHDLIFYHFSGYNPAKPDMASSRGNVPITPFSERPDLRPIYDDYRSRLYRLDYESIQSLPYSLRKKPQKFRITNKFTLRSTLRRVFEALPDRFQKRFRLWRSSRWSVG
jgi:hypothetical protein